MNDWWGLTTHDFDSEDVDDGYYDGMSPVELAAQLGMERI